MKKVLSVLSLCLLGAAMAFANGAQENAAGGSGTSEADNWPNRPITIVCPFSAGGDSDFNARTLAKYLTTELGQPVVVENIKGSGGSVGTEDVASAAPDGYRVLQTHNALQIAHASGISDVSLDSMEFVALTAQNPGDVVAVAAKSGIKTMKELVEASQQKKMTIATNIGATTQIESFMIGEYANVTQVDVGAIADKITAMLGGQVDIIIGPYGSIKPYAENGDCNIIGVCTPERAKGFSDIPTLKEQGYDITWQTSFFYAFPKGTPQAIVDKFSKALEKIITTNKDYQDDIMKSFYQSPIFLPGEQGLEVLRQADEKIMKYKLTSLN